MTVRDSRSTAPPRYCGESHAIPEDSLVKMGQRADEVARLFMQVRAPAVRAIYLANYVEIVALLGADRNVTDAVCFLHHCFLDHGLDWIRARAASDGGE